MLGINRYNVLRGDKGGEESNKRKTMRRENNSMKGKELKELRKKSQT